MRFGDDAQFLDRSWVEPYTGPRVTCEAHCSERATHTVVLDADEGQFVSVCERHLKGYRETT